VPEPHDHGKNLIRRRQNELIANSLILRVYDVLMNDSNPCRRRSTVPWLPPYRPHCKLPFASDKPLWAATMLSVQI